MTESKTDLVLRIAAEFCARTGRRDFAAPELTVPGMTVRAVRQTLRCAAHGCKAQRITFSRRESGDGLARKTYYRFITANPVQDDDRVTQEMAAKTLCALWGYVPAPIMHATLVPLFSSQPDE